MVDGKIQGIVKILPGVDCGGCGYATCQECAQAIADGESIALCPALFQKDVDKIAELMGVETVAVADNVAFVRCNGKAAKKEVPEGMKCDDVVKQGFEEGTCRYGCIGGGTCVTMCKFDAMKLEDGVVKIDKEKCNGCMACVGACVQKIITMVPREATNFIPCANQEDEDTTRAICGSGCIGCGECEKACPQEAVKVVNNVAVIDYDKCVGCVACTVKCEKKIIIDTLHDLTKVKDHVAFVACNGGQRTHHKLESMGITTCEEAAKARTKDLGICTEGCCGFGSCEKVCRYDAIKVVDGCAKVDPDKCVGCLDCVHACPNNVIQEVLYKGAKHVACSSTLTPAARAEVCLTGCIGCGDCERNCPNGAIKVERGHAVVDEDLCENCNICSYVCTREVLSEQVVPEENYLQRIALNI
ncbi:MAG: 4Fe-4S binding protein [Clostridia bacterium]|nr:4Fe-4S binding protein [Clostridia bacterium]